MLKGPLLEHQHQSGRFTISGVREGVGHHHTRGPQLELENSSIMRKYTWLKMEKESVRQKR